MNEERNRHLAHMARRRRALFFGLTFASSILATLLMLDILNANGLTFAEHLALPLFFILFTWIAGAFWTAIAGFCIRLIGRDPAVPHPEDVAGRPVQGRTALILCTYNEDFDHVAAGIDAIWTSLMKQPEQAKFDFFILSDTRKPDIAAQEETGWKKLVRRHNARGRIFYRRREKNTSRKAGNVADFVTKWGAGYDYMIVLDADSVMSGNAVVTLAKLMDASPQIGLLQTLPCPAGRETLFARLQQFAARLNSQMLSSGLAFWQLSESNYWGHNAIIRVRAFAQYCALPRLPGSEPFGGEILSHDFVEAALMRKAGYEVWMVPDLEGSWEQVPSNLIDFAARDRRWAQGNLQHLGVMPLKGLHWVSRIHMITGVLAYVTSPLWMIVLILSSIVTCQEAIRGYQYFEPGTYSLFPIWPEYRTGEIALLLTVTIVVLLLPKVLGATLALVNPVQRKLFGGTANILKSLFAEQLFSMLLAPAMMIFHTSFVLQTLSGIVVKWDAQARDDRGISFREAFIRMKWHVFIGIAWGAVILALAPRFIWWMLPVIAGLLLSPPLAVLTSRATVGHRLRERGYFLTPEETSTPVELMGIEAVNTPEYHAPATADDFHPVPEHAPLRMEAAPFDRYSLRYGLAKRAPVVVVAEDTSAANPRVSAPQAPAASSPRPAPQRVDRVSA
ncbi:MAG TPA: glucans biosynthesis glucosyltransferase MdoH [Steroidobacteraceae bacterium]|nr:glucans biosynthesis glucosyltransferase MdoH [Steroidobacteraceae bacterium]